MESENSEYGRYIVTGTEADLNLPSYRHEIAKDSGGNSIRIIYLDLLSLK